MITKEQVESVLEAVPPSVPAALPGTSQDARAISLDDRLREVETTLIRWALKVSGGNKSRAAELLQIKRSTLGDRINRCGLGQKRAGGEGAVDGAHSVATMALEESHVEESRAAAAV